MTLERIRISVEVEVDVESHDQSVTVVRKIVDAVMPALSKVMRRTDTPTVRVETIT